MSEAGPPESPGVGSTVITPSCHRVRRETAAHDLARTVDAIRGPGTATEGAEVRHLASLPQDGVTGWRGRGGVSAADGLPRIVDRKGDAGAEVRHRSVLPHERAHRVGGILALADDETRIADIMCGAAGTAERPEVRHDAVV